jgi:hypothetical protein
MCTQYLHHIHTPTHFPHLLSLFGKVGQIWSITNMETETEDLTYNSTTVTYVVCNRTKTRIKSSVS